jgi:hypothetical protein
VNEGQLGSITLTTDDDQYKVQAISRTAVNDGVWHHVVGMRNAGQLRLYVDGVLDGGGYLPSQYDLSGTSGQSAYIGAITSKDDNSLYKYFVGVIDELCIISAAVDAIGVGALYSGEEPSRVAKTAAIARAGGTAPRSRAATLSPRRGIEGDWRIVSDQVSQQAKIEIRKSDDGALAATVVATGADETSPAIPLDQVTFEDGTLRFKMMSNQGRFEGKMKEDGLTIEGRFQQQGQTTGLVLKRIVATPSQAIPVAQQELQNVTPGAGNIAVALVLILALAGVVAAIVFFLVKSSIR